MKRILGNGLMIFWLCASSLLCGGVSGLSDHPAGPGGSSPATLKNLTVNFSGMAPGAGQLLELRVLDIVTFQETARTRVEAVTADFSVVLAALEVGRSYEVDFYVDQNGNGLYDAPPTDQAWILFVDNVQGDTGVNFTYNTEFMDIFWVYVLRIQFTGMTPYVGQLLELRVVGRGNIESGRRKIAAVPSDTFIAEIPCLAYGAEYRLDLYADLNGNKLYDAPPTDHAWRTSFQDTTGDFDLGFTPGTAFTDIDWRYIFTLNLFNMDQHLGQLFELRVVETARDLEVGRVTLQNFYQPNLSFSILGIRPGQQYRVDFYADNNSDFRYSPPPLDYAWRLAFQDTAGDFSLDFDHNNTLTDIQWPPLNTFYFPRLSYHPGFMTDGYGFLNPGDYDIQMDLAAYGTDGGVLVSTGDSFLPAFHQAAQQVESLFSLSGPADGWVIGTANRNPIGYFLTQFFNLGGGMTGLDGAEIFTSAMSEGILPRVKTTGDYSTELSLCNPGDLAIQVTLTGYDGTQVLPGGSFTVPAKGSTQVIIGQQFTTKFDGCLRAQSTGQFVGNAIIRLGSLAIGSVNLQPVDAAATAWNAPHVVLFPDAYYSEFNLVNPHPTPARVRLSPYYSDGTAITAPFEVTIPAEQVLILRDSDLGLPAGAASEGWIGLQSQDNTITGCLTFGNPLDDHYLTTLPLQSQPRSEFYFAQVANGNVGGVDYFTGISVVNPNGSACDVTIRVYASDGALNGSVTVPVAARSKFVRLLHLIEGIGPLPDQSSGFIQVVATQPVYSFVLFGDEPLNFLSAVPAQQ